LEFEQILKRQKDGFDRRGNREQDASKNFADENIYYFQMILKCNLIYFGSSNNTMVQQQRAALFYKT